MVIIFGKALVIFLLIKNGLSTPVVDLNKSSKYEEYIIEHEISSGQAKNTVLSMDLSSKNCPGIFPSIRKPQITIPPGCQKCNEKEIRYCLGADLISDHCCCDKRYREFFPYIPHTCYFGTQLCTTVASDCTEYQRLRTCCCQTYAVLKWRAKSSAVVITEDKIKIASLFLFIILKYVFFMK